MFQKAQYLFSFKQINLQQLGCHNTFLNPPSAIAEHMILN